MANSTNDTDPMVLSTVSVIEFTFLTSIWLIYCCLGPWSLGQPLRIVSLLQGCVKILIYNVWYCQRYLPLSMFTTYMLGRTTMDTSRVGRAQGSAVVLWMILDSAAVFYAPLRIANLVYEALLAIVLVVRLVTMTMALQERGRRRWQLKTGAIALWGLGWGILALLYWMNIVSQITLAAWLMSYGACFPKQEKSGASPGRTPSVMFNSPWLRKQNAERAAETTL